MKRIVIMGTSECPACKIAKAAYPDAEYVLCEDDWERANKYNVMAAPTIVLLEDEEPVDSWVGFSSDVKEKIDSRLG